MSPLFYICANKRCFGPFSLGNFPKCMGIFLKIFSRQELYPSRIFTQNQLRGAPEIKKAYRPPNNQEKIEGAQENLVKKITHIYLQCSGNFLNIYFLKKLF